mmetsp:Transcript_6370/g.9010  ORF Transcript_6370/g.9010 Transcript_6370/m.9010 type:complete len:286 (+) Transcript_6370:190-1047(+)
MCSVFSSLLGAIFFATATKSFSFSHCCRRSSSYISSTALRVSELHIPGYAQTKLPFILKDEDLIVEAGGQPTLTRVDEREYRDEDYSSLIPYETGHLLHKTTNPIFSEDECKRIVNEAEKVAAEMGWTTSRHGNYPTTDIPIVELPDTLRFFRLALQERIYPLLRKQFGEFLPGGGKSLRVADGFIVKYDAEGGQTELKPHRDGSVLSFNIALNPATDFDGGGTWFASLNDAVKIDQGEVVSHASGVLHGGHGISTGKRYIMVCFVILEGYDSWSMRFYNNVRNL